MHIYNLKKDENDIRDFQFHKKINMVSKQKLPTKYSITNLPQILDQELLGSCTANAASNALRILLRKNSKPEFQPSRLFIYWMTRLLHNTINVDSGASLRYTMKSISKNGACDEEIWIYDIKKFMIKPSDEAINDALPHRIGFKYYSVQPNLNTIKNALFQGFPIVCGIMVYTSFESDEVTKTGIVQIPNISKEELLGGHAILMISYDDEKKEFGFMNSWGTWWGNNGFFTLPYGYIFNNNLAFDFWAIQYFS